MTALDPRILTAGIAVTLDTLVAVFADHARGIPAAFTCPTCEHRFDPDDRTGDCPTNTVVRPLLQRRKHERIHALSRLTIAQIAELEIKPTRPSSTTDRVAAPDSTALFDTTSLRRHLYRATDPETRRRTR
jgi:hypothetical protein